MNDIYITPCVGICKLSDADFVCVGCGRTKEEIRDWNRYSHEERMVIMKRLGYGKHRKRSKK